MTCLLTDNIMGRHTIQLAKMLNFITENVSFSCAVISTPPPKKNCYNPAELADILRAHNNDKLLLRDSLSSDFMLS